MSLKKPNGGESTSGNNLNRMDSTCEKELK